MPVKLIWATQDADTLLAKIARVSNPNAQDKPIGNLLQYMMEHGHSSPFEMANMCLEIDTTRDIARQILRHRSFSFQEFSQRYQDVTQLGSEFNPRECRLQDTKNRQNSLQTDDTLLAQSWEQSQKFIWDNALQHYEKALEMGIAKEQARALLPEGLTPSRIYMNGNFRSWIFYLKQRLDPSTQKEHREIAQEILEMLYIVAPVVATAFFGEQNV